jgi:hypothetical protein
VNSYSWKPAEKMPLLDGYLRVEPKVAHSCPTFQDLKGNFLASWNGSGRISWLTKSTSPRTGFASMGFASKL